MKNIFHSLCKIWLLYLLVSVSFFACKKTDTTATVPVAAVPIITNVQPKNPLPGDVITITGTGFGTLATNVKVTIGSQVITITTVSDTEIKFTLAAGITAGDIAVTIKNIIATNTDPQKATITPVIPLPAATTIVSINPTSGKVGDVLTITGTNFSTTAVDNVVKFNGVVAKVTSSAATVLTLTVPATATTGPITLSVKGASVITGPTFTVSTATGGTGTAVPYIVAVGGTATFAKIATAAGEIGAMTIDKKNNILYYSDYVNNLSYATHKGTLYKLKLDGSAPDTVTTDPRITAINNIAIDPANGNIVVEASLDQLGLKSDIYNIDANTAAITVVSKSANSGGAGNGYRYIDTKGAYWAGYGQKLNVTTGNFDHANFPFTGEVQNLFMGDNLYVGDWDRLNSHDLAFSKYNLTTNASSLTDFTLKGLFSADDPSWNAGTNFARNINTNSKIAIDDQENVYVIYPYYGGAATQSNNYYVIRKTKNGAGGASTLVTKFYTKLFSDPTAPPLVFYKDLMTNSDIKFQADGSGNLYIKDNGTDIIKITP
jgi:hypothetical protein